MTTQTMIEKLTWDIWSEYAGTLTMYDAKNIVKQILEGLREPTEEMNEAAKPFRKGVGETAERLFRAMIDATLQEKG